MDRYYYSGQEDRKIGQTYPKIKLSCELKCGMFLYHEDMAHHLKNDCGLAEKMCTLGCGVKLTRQGMPFHLRDKYQLRMLTCEHCKEEFKSRDLCAHGGKCPKMNVKCELKCGETIRREEMNSRYMLLTPVYSGKYHVSIVGNISSFVT